MNKYNKYKNLYFQQKKMFGGSDINDLIGRVNDKSVFYLLKTLEYGISYNSIAYIYWEEDFSPFTLAHSRFIITAINNLIESNILINNINVFLVPKFNSTHLNIKWSDKLEMIKIAVKELKKIYQPTQKKVLVNFYASDFSQTINSSIYLYENFSFKPDIYLELELFCKLNTINPSQLYYIVEPDNIISLFSGINQTNTIHLISKYNFITWSKIIPHINLEVITKYKYIDTKIDLQNLELIFKQNIANFKSKQLEYPDLSLIKYDNKRLDFFYDGEIKLNGELDYMTMELTINDIQSIKMGKIIICIFTEDLELTSSIIKNGIQFINQNIFPSLINYIAVKGIYF